MFKILLTYTQNGAIFVYGGVFMGDNVRLNITLPDAVYRQLLELAERHGLSKSAMLALLITTARKEER